MTAIGSAQAPQRETPNARVFAPGIISAGNVFRGTFSPDGHEFLFFKSVATEGEQYRIFRSVRNGEEWSTPETVVLGNVASDRYLTFDPVTGNPLFASYRPAPGKTSAHPSACPLHQELGLGMPYSWDMQSVASATIASTVQEGADHA